MDLFDLLLRETVFTDLPLEVINIIRKKYDDLLKLQEPWLTYRSIPIDIRCYRSCWLYNIRIYGSNYFRICEYATENPSAVPESYNKVANVLNRNIYRDFPNLFDSFDNLPSGLEYLHISKDFNNDLYESNYLKTQHLPNDIIQDNKQRIHKRTKISDRQRIYMNNKYNIRGGIKLHNLGLNRLSKQQNQYQKKFR